MKRFNRESMLLAAALAFGLAGAAAAADDVKAGGATRPVPAKAKVKAKADAKVKPGAPRSARQQSKDGTAKAAAKARPATRSAAATKAAAAAKSAAARPKVARPQVTAAVPPRELHWTQLPPSRFYPNGIPELRPEFLYPLPGAQAQAVAEPQRHPGAEPAMLP